MLQLNANMRELDAVREQFRKLPRIYTRIAYRALNRAGQGVITDGIKLLTKRYAQKATFFRKRFRIRRAHSRNLSVNVRCLASRASHISDWNAVQNEKEGGVTFQVLRSGKSKTIERAFIAPGKNSKKPIVFRRKACERYPIKVLYTVSGFDVLRSKSMRKDLLIGAEKRLMNTIKSNTKWELEKIAEKAKG